MKVPRDIQGRDLADHLCRAWGYYESHYTGSHIMLDTDTPTNHRVPIPAHKPVRIGTLNNILRAVAQHKGVTREDILRDL